MLLSSSIVETPPRSASLPAGEAAEAVAEAAKKMKRPTEAAYLNCTTVLSTC
jgi:hypothetical protein